ncbi:hypothetical protein B4096_1509 [Heyndrickxia coagulans]|uniref:Uncharacterized protein n=1 Tax=Heyndrickxia coagulans TaxID=1398 RepID=A0A133L0S6_HEYCO|nr:hypothetical protein HMPREF3213_00519 [Heyndrickxia coagulans]KYC86400.1 hypothetical protein B4096_1509 [Heyndrickxia coagulans]
MIIQFATCISRKKGTRSRNSLTYIKQVGIARQKYIQILLKLIS